MPHAMATFFELVARTLIGTSFNQALKAVLLLVSSPSGGDAGRDHLSTGKSRGRGPIALRAHGVYHRRSIFNMVEGIAVGD